ncbi:MAG: hypothetical protein FJ038_02895 [Chloroflexi bacterium]|nr:hypothetical protein [Chloroflexota bacterium]
MKPRLAAIMVAVTFVIVSTAYFAFSILFGGHVDYAGVTMLLALAVAMSVMFYVLLAGSPGDQGEHSGPTSGPSGH